ncbi:hypothetical protein EZV62_002927 [Acer yangbiense]|uniref:Uncharacterized protein n=1 Tax=Acer yangbiense TaxID=1000413 RepID=A0A5C7IYZ3_9ROSI|nr:hypothetical protein EZV62_002927 [Acer yangbiense]
MDSIMALSSQIPLSNCVVERQLSQSLFGVTEFRLNAAERIEMTDVVAKLSVIWEKFLRCSLSSIFSDCQTLHEFVKMTLPERVTEIFELSLLLEVGAGINNNVENSASRQGEGRGRIEECLVAVLRIGALWNL